MQVANSASNYLCSATCDAYFANLSMRLLSCIITTEGLDTWILICISSNVTRDSPCRTALCYLTNSFSILDIDSLFHVCVEISFCKCSCSVMSIYSYSSLNTSASTLYFGLFTLYGFKFFLLCRFNYSFCI